MNPAASTSLLEVNNIEVVYHNFILVLKGLSLKVPEGRIVAVLGNNGAGKTTTLKAISGLLKSEDDEVTDGQILFKGERIDRRYPEDLVRMGIFQVMEGRRVFEYSTSLPTTITRGSRDTGTCPPRTSGSSLSRASTGSPTPAYPRTRP